MRLIRNLSNYKTKLRFKIKILKIKNPRHVIPLISYNFHTLPKLPVYVKRQYWSEKHKGDDVIKLYREFPGSI